MDKGVVTGTFFSLSFFNNKSAVTSTFPLPLPWELAESTTWPQEGADGLYRSQIGEMGKTWVCRLLKEEDNNTTNNHIYFNWYVFKAMLHFLSFSFTSTLTFYKPFRRIRDVIIVYIRAPSQSLRGARPCPSRRAAEGRGHARLLLLLCRRRRACTRRSRNRWWHVKNDWKKWQNRKWRYRRRRRWRVK